MGFPGVKTVRARKSKRIYEWDTAGPESPLHEFASYDPTAGPARS
jgi:hypothetical protein